MDNKYKVWATSPIATPEFTVNQARRQWHRLLLLKSDVKRPTYILKDQCYDGANGEWYDSIVINRSDDISIIMGHYTDKMAEWEHNDWLVASYVL